MSDKSTPEGGSQSEQNPQDSAPVPQPSVPEPDRPAPSPAGQTPSQSASEPSDTESAPAGLQPGAQTPANPNPNPDPAGQPAVNQPPAPASPPQPPAGAAAVPPANQPPANQQGSGQQDSSKSDGESSVSETVQNIASNVGSAVSGAASSAASYAQSAATQVSQQITPKQANALKIGAIMGATMAGVTFVFSFITMLLAPALTGAAGEYLSKVNVFSRAGLLTNVAFGGKAKVEFDYFGFTFDISFGVLFFTGAILGMLVAFFVGRILWKSSPVAGEANLWIAVGTMTLTTWLPVCLLTLVSGVEVPGGEEVHGTYLSPLVWIALASILIVFLLAFSRGERGATIIRYAGKFRAYWAPALFVVLAMSVVASVIILLFSLFSGKIGGFFSGLIFFPVTLVSSAIPILFGANFAPSGGPFDTPTNSWGSVGILGTIVLIVSVLIVLIVGLLARQRVRGTNTSPVFIGADIAAFAVFGILAMLAIHLKADTHVLGGKFGLGFAALLIDVFVGAVVTLVHTFALPPLRKAVQPLAQAEYKLMKRPVPRWLVPFTAYGTEGAPAPADPAAQAAAAAAAPIMTTSAGQPFHDNQPTVPAPAQAAPGEPAPSLPPQPAAPAAGAMSAPPVPPPAKPRTPEEAAAAKKRNKLIALIVGIVAVVIIALVIAFKVLSSMLFSPEAAVEEYWDNLSDGRASDARAMELENESSALITDDVLKAAEARPTGVEVEMQEESDNLFGDDEDGERYFNIKYVLDGTSYTTEMSVTPGPKKFGVFNTWRITRPQYAYITISSEPSLVNGTVKVEPDTYAVYPGKYSVSIDTGSEYLASTSPSAVLGVDDSENLSPKFELTDKTKQLAVDAFKKRLEECGKVTTSRNKPCGTDMWLFRESRYDITWTVPTDPGELKFESSSPQEWWFYPVNDLEIVGKAVPNETAGEYDEEKTEKRDLYLRGRIKLLDPKQPPVIEID